MKTVAAAVASSLLLLLCASAQAQPPSFHSGKYESLMVAVSETGTVEGYLSEQSGDAFRCAFYLKGNLEPSGLVHAQTWSDSMKPGLIGPSDGGLNLAVVGAREYPGCANVLIPEIDNGVEFSQTREAQWVKLVTISADKAFLMSTPDPKANHKAYVVGGDVVGVLGFQDGWAHVEFINAQDRSFKGWINNTQYQAIEAPR